MLLKIFCLRQHKKYQSESFLWCDVLEISHNGQLRWLFLYFISLSLSQYVFMLKWALMRKFSISFLFLQGAFIWLSGINSLWRFSDRKRTLTSFKIVNLQEELNFCTFCLNFIARKNPWIIIDIGNGASEREMTN